MSAPIRIFNNVAIASAADFISDIIEVGIGATLLSLHMQWTGDPTGTFALFQSNFPQPGKNKTQGWVPVPIGEVDFTGKNPAGAAGSSFSNISAVSGCKYLLVYTQSGGTGVLDAFSVTKNA